VPVVIVAVNCYTMSIDFALDTVVVVVAVAVVVGVAIVVVVVVVVVIVVAVVVTSLCVDLVMDTVAVVVVVVDGLKVGSESAVAGVDFVVNAAAFVGVAGHCRRSWRTPVVE